MSNCVRLHGLQPIRFFRPWDFPGKSTGVGCHCLLLRRRRGGIKREENKLAINTSLCVFHRLDPSEIFTELHKEEKRDEEDRGDQEAKGGESKEERPIQQVISSLSVLHSQEHPERLTELSRKEKGEGEDRGDLEIKGRVQRGESNQASNQHP